MRALVFLAPLLAAGCLGSALATAMDTRDLADEAAQLWDLDAKLAGALGVEGTAPLARWAVSALTHAPLDDARGADDPRVGDGRAEAWIYKYVSPREPNAYVVIVDAEGDVRSSRETPRNGNDEPLARWTIDSDKALRLAAEANQGLQVGTHRDAYGVVSALAMEDGTPVWHILGGGRNEGSRAGGYVKLNAATGAILSSAGSFAGGTTTSP